MLSCGTYHLVGIHLELSFRIELHIASNSPFAVGSKGSGSLLIDIIECIEVSIDIPTAAHVIKWACTPIYLLSFGCKRYAARKEDFFIVADN